jgi:hypothetical protein
MIGHWQDLSAAKGPDKEIGGRVSQIQNIVQGGKNTKDIDVQKRSLW